MCFFAREYDVLHSVLEEERMLVEHFGALWVKQILIQLLLYAIKSAKQQPFFDTSNTTDFSILLRASLCANRNPPACTMYAFKNTVLIPATPLRHSNP